MLIRIGEDCIYNTEADCAIEHKVEERHEYWFDSREGETKRDYTKPSKMVVMVVSKGVRLEGEAAAEAWTKLCEVADTQASALFNPAHYVPNNDY